MCLKFSVCFQTYNYNGIVTCDYMGVSVLFQKVFMKQNNFLHCLGIRNYLYLPSPGESVMLFYSVTHVLLSAGKPINKEVAILIKENIL